MTNVLTNLSHIHVSDSYLSTMNPSIKSSSSSLLKHFLSTDIVSYINKDKVKQLIDFSQIKPSVKDYTINNKYIFAQIQGYANIAEPLNANTHEDYDDLDVVEKTESKYLQGDDDANTNDKNENVVYKLKFTNGVEEFYGFEYNKFNNEILTVLKYLNAFTPNGEKPAGAYYYAVNDNFSDADEKSIAMYGKTLLNEEVILASDNTMVSDQEKASDVIDVKRKATKTKGMTISGNLTDENTLNGYVKYAKLITEQALDHIINGVAIPSPYKGACEYCEYGSICGKDDADGYKERKVSDVDSKTILSAVNITEKNANRNETEQTSESATEKREIDEKVKGEEGDGK